MNKQVAGTTDYWFRKNTQECELFWKSPNGVAADMGTLFKKKTKRKTEISELLNHQAAEERQKKGQVMVGVGFV